VLEQSCLQPVLCPLVCHRSHTDSDVLRAGASAQSTVGASKQHAAASRAVGSAVEAHQGRLAAARPPPETGRRSSGERARRLLQLSVAGTTGAARDSAGQQHGGHDRQAGELVSLQLP